jgi:hypothetical protein
MKKRSYKTEINEISAILRKSPTLKEALSFDEDFDDMSYDDEMPMDDEMGGGMGEPMPHQCNAEGEELVNTIRKMALEGMSKLADCTEDPCYDVLKRVWQTCDKVIADKKNPQQMNK